MVSIPGPELSEDPLPATAALPRLTLPVIAVIVPCFNEEQVLPITLERLLTTLRRLVAEGLVAPASYLACVDDGSTDATWEIITRGFTTARGQVKGIKLTRNFGHQNALVAGLHGLAYDAAITIDADLQDPPEVMAEMVARFAEGFDIVYGVRNDRATDTLFKKTTAEWYYRLLASLHVRLVYNHADYRLLSRRVVEALSSFKEHHLFLRGLIPYIGYPSTEVYYARAPRQAGSTKYPLRKMLAFAWDGLISFSLLPLTVITVAGALIMVAAFILLIWLLTRRLAGSAMPDWYVLLVAQGLLNGLCIFSIGILGQYVGRIYQEVRERPRFVIEKRLL